MALTRYNPGEVSVSVGGFDISGFADGTFVTVARENPAFNLTVGADGDATRAKSNDNSGSITITLLSGSPSNDVLSQLAQADETSGAGLVVVMVKDNSGSTLALAETGWIERLPDTVFDREVTEREWVLRTDNLQLFVGGNNA